MPSKYLVDTDGARLAQELGARWDAASGGVWPERVFPKLQAPVVVWSDGARTLRAMRFGFFPPFAKDLKAKTVHNARWETVAELPTFRAPFLHSRCLIPLTGFWEYSDFVDPPRWFGWLAPAHQPLGVAAGLWTSWRPAEGSPIDVFTLITRDAPPNAMQVGVTRIPIWLPAESWDGWLDPAQRNTRTLEQILEHYDPLELIVEQQAPPPRIKKAAPEKTKAGSANLSFDFPSDGS